MSQGDLLTGEFPEEQPTGTIKAGAQTKAALFSRISGAIIRHVRSETTDTEEQKKMAATMIARTFREGSLSYTELLEKVLTNLNKDGKI